MNKDKLEEAINMMGEALNEETQAASSQKVAGHDNLDNLCGTVVYTIWQMDLHMNLLHQL